MKVNFKKIGAIALAVVLVLMALSMTACQKAEKTKINVAAIKGPTGMGMTKLMSDSDNGMTANEYTFQVVSAPTEIPGKINSGEVDIAAMPTNLAATLYGKAKNISVIALNTKGVLYILEKGTEINSVADLRGKTIYTAGQGSNPEYILKYLLEQAGLVVGTDVFVEFASAHDEVATLFAAGTADVVMLPEPNVSATLAKVEGAHVAINMSDAWAESGNGELVMGCLVVRNDFLAENKEAVDKFLSEYKASVEFVNGNVEDASSLCAEYGIIPAQAIAKAAIPRSALTYIAGADMQAAINGYFGVLFAANASSVGGAIPDEAFYYSK